MSPKIRFVVGDSGPSGYFRLVLPCETLKAGGDDAAFAFHYEDFEGADVLVFQRQYRPEAMSEMLRWKERGKKIVIDFDDNFFQLDPHNISNQLYTPQIAEKLKELVGAVDAVTTATGPLAKVYGAYAKTTVVLPNSLPKRVFDFERRVADHIIVGWHGSDSHQEDVKLLRGPLNSLARHHDFELVVAGYNPRGLFKQVTERPWIRFNPDLTYFEQFADFSIGLCPLAKTPFNEGKSDLKWLENSSLGIPTIASSLHPYREIEHEKTGLLARNAADWEKSIARLLEDESLRTDLGAAAREHVREERTIESNIEGWRSLYSSL